MPYVIAIIIAVFGLILVGAIFYRLLQVDKALKNKKYQSTEQGFVDLLNYAALIDDGIILGKNGSLMAAWCYSGDDHETSIDEQREYLSEIISKTLAPLGNGWMIHVDAVRQKSPTYYPEEKSFFPDPISKALDEERRTFFEEKGQLYEGYFILTITWFPPILAQRKFIELMFDDENKQKDKHLETEKIINKFYQQIETIENQLSNVLNLKRLKQRETKSLDGTKVIYEDFLSWLQFCITGIAHPIRLPKNPIYLDAIIGGQELRAGVIPKIGRNFIQTIAIEGFPSESYPGILNTLAELPVQYRWSSRFIFLDQHEAREHFKKFRKKWRQKVRGFFDQIFHTNSGSINHDALRMVEDADAAIADIDGGVGVGYYTSVIILIHEDREILEEQAKEIEKTIQRLGFSARTETINNLEAYLGSLPGHGVENIRRPLINTLNLADLLPTSSIWIGEKECPCPLYLGNPPPIMQCITKGDTPFHLNLHVRDVGHSFMFGPTGAGKSTHLAIIAAQLLRYKNMSIFAFDKGMSLYPLTKAVKGLHFELASENNELSFCPLQFLENNSDISWAIQWIESILSMNNIAITPDINAAIEVAIHSMHKTQSKTMTDFYNTVQHQTIRDVISQYTIKSSMGYLLDAESDNLKLSNFSTFEIEELMNLQDKYALPVLLYLFRRIERNLKGQPAAIILDEAWLMLSHAVFRDKIKEWLKVLRKANCFVLMATQSLSDAMNSDIFDVIVESTATKIFLPNLQARNEDIYQLYQRMGLNSKQIAILSQALPKKQYYLFSEQGNRLYELCLGKLALAFVGSSDKESITKIKELEAQFGEGWIKEWLNIKNINIQELHDGVV